MTEHHQNSQRGVDVPVSPERARDILAAYGANPDHWPEEERRGMEAMLAESPELNDVIAQEEALDCFLDAAMLSGSSAGTAADVVLAHVWRCDEQCAAPIDQADWFDRLLSWLRPRDLLDLWRVGLLASAPFALGVLMAILMPSVESDWSAQEQYLLMPIGEEMSDG